MTLLDLRLNGSRARRSASSLLSLNRTKNRERRMGKATAFEEVDRHKRRLLGATAATIATAQLGMSRLAYAQSSPRGANMPAVKPGTNTSFRLLKQIDAGLLSVGYAEDGPADGPVVFLLHGWPYDIHSFVDVTPMLASVGYRVIVPFLRGYGSTRFLSNETVRNGQPAAVALDAVALMDALKIEKATLAGFDWG